MLSRQNVPEYDRMPLALEKKASRISVKFHDTYYLVLELLLSFHFMFFCSIGYFIFFSRPY